MALPEALVEVVALVEVAPVEVALVEVAPMEVAPVEADIRCLHSGDD